MAIVGTTGQGYAFVKGHGTENDFVLLPDADGDVHGGLSEAAYVDRVRALCDRRAGLGGDGVIRVVRTAALGPADDDADGCVNGAAAAGGSASEWFMDYRNADGSLSEMCGNGVRVLGRYLVEHEHVDGPLVVGTRAGDRTLTFRDDGLISVDMGRPRVLGATTVGVDGRTWDALHVDLGNPHAVAFVDSLGDPTVPLGSPAYDARVFPAGVNVELVVRRGPGHVAMRVHERGSGETRSCGTGACAVAVAAALADGGGPGSAYRVGVPGGRLELEWTAEDRVLLTGPALLVASGTTVL